MTYIKKALLILTIFTISAVSVFSEDNPLPRTPITLESLKENADNFTQTMAKSLPFNSAIGLNWSDAYIGKLYPSKPPHLGFGISFGFTTTELAAANKLLESMGSSIPDEMPGKNKLPLPGYTLEARLGGIKFPFDLGFKFGILDFSPDLFGIGIDYLLIGGDLRYAILEGEKLPVRLSLGIGFNYMKGGINTSLGSVHKYTFEGNDGIYTISVTDPKLGVDWNTKSLDLKAQTSIRLKAFNPYIGIGASHAWSQAGYRVSADTVMHDDNNKKQTINKAYQEYLSENLDITDVTEEGFESIQKINGWNTRLFGGFAIRFAKVIALDFTVMYDFMDSNWGGTVGFRFQL